MQSTVQQHESLFFCFKKCFDVIFVSIPALHFSLICPNTYLILTTIRTAQHRWRWRWWWRFGWSIHEVCTSTFTSLSYFFTVRSVKFHQLSGSCVSFLFSTFVACRAEYRKKLKIARAEERKKSKKTKPYFDFLGKSNFTDLMISIVCGINVIKSCSSFSYWLFHFMCRWFGVRALLLPVDHRRWRRRM